MATKKSQKNARPSLSVPCRPPICPIRGVFGLKLAYMLGHGRLNFFFNSAAGFQGSMSTTDLSTIAAHRNGPKAARISCIGLAPLFSLANPGIRKKKKKKKQHVHADQRSLREVAENAEESEEEEREEALEGVDGLKDYMDQSIYKLLCSSVCIPTVKRISPRPPAGTVGLREHSVSSYPRLLALSIEH